MAVSGSAVLDTNAYAAFKKGDAQALSIMQRLESIILCPIVLGELLAGFKLGNREKANQAELRLFLQEPQVLFLTINAQTAASYAEIYQELRQNGTPIPTNDMWIAAMARQLNLAVFSFDKHFAKVSGITTFGLEGK